MHLATGQYCSKLDINSPLINQYTSNMRQRAIYWRANAERIWDANGLIEGYYYDCTGVEISTTTRINYTHWCDKYRGVGMIPPKYRVPGAVVFWGDTVDTIGHVAVLIVPVKANQPEGDWIIGEARSIMDGVVMTRMYDRKPTFWGLMTKYYKYPDMGEPSADHLFGERVLSSGMTGSDVGDLQIYLSEKGFNCSHTYVFDKETVTALKGFQTYTFGDPAAATGKMDSTTFNAIYDAFHQYDGRRIRETQPNKHVIFRDSISGEPILSTKKDVAYQIKGAFKNCYLLKLGEYREGWVVDQYVTVMRKRSEDDHGGRWQDNN